MPIKRLTAIFLTLCIALNFLITSGMHVFAAETKIYTYEDFSITYNIQNEWNSGQTIVVSVKNTSEMPILNWAFGYDAGGEIQGLWNANIAYNSGTNYVIKNANFNYEIAPGGSVSFGYTLAGNNLSMPKSFELTSERVKVSDGFTAVLAVQNAWNTGFQGEINLKNTSSQPLEAWTLSFDVNFEISALWNCKLQKRTNNRITVSSEMWTNPIMPGASVKIGMTGNHAPKIIPEVSNISMSKVDAIYRLENAKTQENPAIALEIFAWAETHDDVLSIYWESTIPNGEYSIYESDDGVNFKKFPFCIIRIHMIILKFSRRNISKFLNTLTE